MSETKRNNEFTDEQIKGIDLCVRGIAKKYKFIKGWKLDKNYKNYVSNLYIDIFIDYFEVAKEIDSKISPFWLDYYKDYRELKSSSLGSHMESDENSKDEIFQKSYTLLRNVTNNLNYLYSKLPDNMQISYKSDFGGQHLCNLGVNEFIQYKDWKHE